MLSELLCLRALEIFEKPLKHMRRLGLTRMDSAGQEYSFLLCVISHIVSKPHSKSCKFGIGLKQVIFVELKELLQLLLKSCLQEPLNSTPGGIALLC